MRQEQGQDCGSAREARRVTWLGLLLNLALVGMKLGAGVLGRSQALIADAVHSASDLVTDGVVLAGIRLGRAPADEGHHFGHARLETLAGAVVGLALVGAGVLLGVQAAVDIYRQAPHHPNWLAPAAAAVSLVVKELLYQRTMRLGRRLNSAALKANAWHHRSDALSSLAVLLGAGAAVLEPAWHILDAYAAFVVCFFVAAAGVEISWEAAKELTDTAPEPGVVNRMEDCARRVPGVGGVHDLKARASGGRYQVELHVEVDGELSVRRGHAIAKEVETRLKEELEMVEKVIIHIDPD